MTRRQKGWAVFSTWFIVAMIGLAVFLLIREPRREAYKARKKAQEMTSHALDLEETHHNQRERLYQRTREELKRSVEAVDEGCVADVLSGLYERQRKRNEHPAEY